MYAKPKKAIQQTLQLKLVQVQSLTEFLQVVQADFLKLVGLNKQISNTNTTFGKNEHVLGTASKILCSASTTFLLFLRPLMHKTVQIRIIHKYMTFNGA